MAQKFDTRYHLIAAKACETTMAYYHCFLRDLANAAYPDHEFITDVAVMGYPRFCYRSSRKGGKHERKIFAIVYTGQDMADMEGVYAERRARHLIPSLGFDEIDLKGYADGVATPKSMIAHTMCHEIAHFMVHLKHGERKSTDDGIHDDTFYAELTAIYDNGGFDYLANDFLERLKRAGIQLREFCLLPDWDYVFAHPDEFECGDRVIVFDCGVRREPSRGVLVKKGKKKAKIAVGSSADWPQLKRDLSGPEAVAWAMDNATRFLMRDYLRLENENEFYLQTA